MTTALDDRRRTMQLDRAALAALQLEKLNHVLAEVLAHNELYQRKLSGCPQRLESLDRLAELPHTTKEELQPAQGNEPFAANLTYPIDRYVRCHQTSGTRGRPLVVLDTADDWRWWLEAWQYVLDAADIKSTDRVLLAFSFGPFIGFWSAFDALVQRGALVIPGGGLSSLARIELMRPAGVTAVCCTPTYALHLAEVAAEHNINLAQLPVEKIIVAGEPGGSVPATCQRIEAAWEARVIDHAGATEVGPWGFADAAGRGLHVNEADFLAEFISVESGHPANEGELSHLILTTLGRTGAPVIRYRTGDIVRPRWPTEGSNRFVLLEGGVLGRADDMMIIRGMNIYPTAIEQILRSFPEVVEYRMTARKRGELDELVVEVEDHLQQPARIAEELRLKLGLKIDVHAVSAMSLPRFEGKGQRFVDERGWKTAEMNPQPTKLELAGPDRLRIKWSGGQVREYTFRELRDNCPCATCREKRKTPPASSALLPIISEADIRPLRITAMNPVGNYAYSIEFSDGHNTGIYTLESLRSMGQEVSAE